MNGFEFIVQGMLNAVGMFIMMTVLGTLSYLALKRWIIKNLTEIWMTMKEEGLRIDGIEIDGKLKTKKLFKKKKKGD